VTRVVILAGEGEYESERTLAGLAVELQQHLPDAAVVNRVASVLDDMPTFPASSFGDLTPLREADVLVLYARFRILPDGEMEELERYLDRGGPVVGLRTSTHAFHYDAGTRWAGWNDGFGRDVLGTPWIAHHGHSSHTVVTRDPGVEHPILDGVDERFEVRSWLYHIELSKPCSVLLCGEPVDPECAPVPGPVAWTTEHNGGRVFYTSLGHPDDFGVPSFRLLLRNAIGWCAGDAAASPR
jgi:type 1 glutamine amidotransferase